MDKPQIPSWSKKKRDDTNPGRITNRTEGENEGSFFSKGQEDFYFKKGKLTSERKQL
jgi:hypothetical protein